MYDIFIKKKIKFISIIFFFLQIFLCGFANEEKEKIVKILNAGGATRYDTINSNLSHILVGNPSKKDSAMLNAVRYEYVL